MPHQQFPEGSGLAVKIDSGLRAVDRALERVECGNIEKRPTHDIVNRKKSIQMFSITPSDQKLIPLCSRAGIAARHTQALIVGYGKAYIDGC